MRIPSHLKIGAHDYKIIVGELENKYGLHDASKATITIDITLPKSRQGSTLLHEVLHALNSELEHALLDSLSEQLFQVLSDNGLLAEETPALTNNV
jgi:hypothetical protein